MNSEESIKGWFHAAAAAYLSILLGHNVKQAIITKKPRNFLNVVLYGLGAGYELWTARYHWSGDGREEASDPERPFGG